MDLDLPDCFQKKIIRLITEEIRYLTYLLFFFGYKIECSFFQKSENLDLFDMVDLARSLGLFRKGKNPILSKFHKTHLVICSHSRKGKTSFRQINMAFKAKPENLKKLDAAGHTMSCFHHMLDNIKFGIIGHMYSQPEIHFAKVLFW